MRARARDRWAATLCLLAWSATLAAGCEPGTAPSPGPAVSPTAVQRRAEPVAHDLAADLPFAWSGAQGQGVDVAAPGAQRQLTQGWYRIQRPKKEEASVWSKGRSSVVELSITQPSDRRLELDLAPLQAPDHLPRQTLRLVWNGHDLGVHPLAWERQVLAVDVPASAQRRGLNRLEILPLWWVSPASVHVALSLRPAAFQLFGVRWAGAAGEGVAADATAAAAPRLEDGRMLQAPGSTITWHYVLPEAPRLRGRVHWTGPPDERDVRWTLSWVAATGEERVLASHGAAELGGAGGVDLDLDLGARAGESVALVSSLLGPSPAAASEDAEGGRLVWERARLEGTRSVWVADAGGLRGRYNVLFVLFDTLRADHVAPYGSGAVRTPTLARLAETGFTFENAFANASWTRPSVVSLWTGLRPSAHRVVEPTTLVPEAAPYLPALLKQAGYVTLAVSNNAHFSPSFGFGRGYDRIVEYYRDRPRVLEQLPDPAAQADHVWSRYLGPAFESRGDRPVLAVLHEIDPHSPYEAPAPYAELYGFGYRGNIDGWNTGDFNEGLRMLRAVNEYGPWLEQADLRQMRAQYAAEVTFMDDYLARLLGHLETAGLREETLVVFLSDHGEQFYEHGAWGHGTSLYEEELRVPLIFSLPGVLPAGGRSRAHAQLIDVTPTVLDLLGLERPALVQGRSLLPDMLGGSAELEGGALTTWARSNFTIHGRGTRFASSEEWQSVRHGDWKLLRHTQRRGGHAFHEYELYDLSRDPEEVLDRWGMEPVIGHALRQLLETRIERDAALDLEAGTSEQMDPDVLQNLRELGYVE